MESSRWSYISWYLGSWESRCLYWSDVCNASHFRQLGLIWPMMWQKCHFKCPWLTSLACGLNGWSPGVALPLGDDLPFPLGNPLPLSPLPLPLPFGLPFPLPLPFDLPLSFPFPLIGWQGPGEVKLVAGSCKYVQKRCFVSCTFCLLTYPLPLPLPFGSMLAKVVIITCFLALVFRYCIILRCSWGVYLLVKLVTFLASNLTSSVKTYSPLCTLTAVKFGLRVAMINFSSSVICFATTLFIFVILPLDILSFTVSA